MKQWIVENNTEILLGISAFWLFFFIMDGTWKSRQENRLTKLENRIDG